MTLAEYLSERGRLSRLAETLRRPITVVHGWKTGRRQLSLADAVAIEEATGGQVTLRELAAGLPQRAAEPVAG